MAQFNFKSTSKKRTLDVSGFWGVDFTSSPENTHICRSSDAPNMIRDSIGKNKGRNGYCLLHTFDDEINGIHTFKEKFLVHSGTKLYLKTDTGYDVIYTNMNNARSNSAVLSDKLIILDGKTMLSYDGETVTDISEIAYVPTVIIGRAPSGGGTLFEPINMISDYRIEKFASDGTSTRYYLSCGSFDYMGYVKMRSSSGEWYELEYREYYTYNATYGYIDFKYSLDAAVDGEDNIMICYRKINNDYRNIIYSCNICTLYGINGALDRIFITGSPNYPSRDYYCQMEDPTYWGDTWYCNIGKSDGAIMGYSLVADCLATHKKGEESNANIILRRGTIMDNEPAFPITGTYTASGAVCSNSFGILDNEPVYLSLDGISAISPSDVLGERSSQTRSYYLNGKLLKEENPENGSAVTYKGFYMLLLNKNIYILDSMQSILKSDSPFSHRQYEGYFWKDIPAKFLFTDNTYLYFAGDGGKLYRFYTDEENIYTDDGNEYETYWETAMYFGEDFSKHKTVTRLAVLLDSDASKAQVLYKNPDGSYTKVMEGKEGHDTNMLARRVHIKDTKGLKFRIKSTLGGGLKINKIQISYIEGRNIK